MSGMTDGVTDNPLRADEDVTTAGIKGLSFSKHGGIFGIVDVDLVGYPVHRIEVCNQHLAPFHHAVSGGLHDLAEVYTLVAE